MTLALVDERQIDELEAICGANLDELCERVEQYGTRSAETVRQAQTNFLLRDNEDAYDRIAKLKRSLHVTALFIAAGSLLGGGTAVAATGAGIAEAAVMTSPLVGVLGFWAVMTIHLRRLG